MSAPSIALDVFNLAMLALNQQTVTSFTDPNSSAAGSGLLLFDQRRRSLIRNYDWNFSRTRGYCQILPTSTPPFDYATYFQMPSNLLKLISVGTQDDAWYPIPYDVQGRNILVNSTDFPVTTVGTTLPIMYAADIVDATQWDSLFMDVLVLDMAFHMCMSTTADQGLQQVVHARMKEMLAEAVAINAQERPLVIIERDPIADARSGFDNNFDLRVNPASWPTF